MDVGNNGSFSTRRPKLHEASPIARVFFGLDAVKPATAPNVASVSAVFPLASQTLVGKLVLVPLFVAFLHGCRDVC